ncbi:hypothetical protein ACFQL1_18250 [Halomicroarcula sp. GCM10025709]|uniref:DUF7504 family protein n=1 Tax=Halomicroarcula sp. GCM10025709 TaxID=3252669 RepID=UPI00360B5F40
MELMATLERLYTDHSQRIRVGIASLTTMSMYADPQQVVRFLHVFSNRIAEIGGSASQSLTPRQSTTSS